VTDWDVVVVGGGPAGLGAAHAAATAGARTLVLEKAEHPRYKTCGGGLIGLSLGALPAGTTVLLGMKPYQLVEVATALAPLCGEGTTLVSILAGTPLADFRRQFPTAGQIVRAMPNLPVGLGQGVTALHAEATAPASARDGIEALIAPLGLAEWIADEGQFNEVTALSGCGPAFLFRFIDALSRAAEAIGLPAEQAARMALATVQGSANMAAQASDSPAVLADRVASPGGMTREGLNVLDADDRLLKLLTDTLAAARDRGEEMARGG